MLFYRRASFNLFCLLLLLLFWHWNYILCTPPVYLSWSLSHLGWREKTLLVIRWLITKVTQCVLEYHRCIMKHVLFIHTSDDRRWCPLMVFFIMEPLSTENLLLSLSYYFRNSVSNGKWLVWMCIEHIRSVIIFYIVHCGPRCEKDDNWHNPCLFHALSFRLHSFVSLFSFRQIVMFCSHDPIASHKVH